MPHQVPAPTLAGWRLWLFRGVVGVGAPILVLVALEAGCVCWVLALIRLSRSPARSRVCPCLADNPRYSWQFFPPAIARQFEPFAFPATKSARTYRAVVLGESAAQGIPDGAYAFARILREMLRSAYPDVQFEVINAGVTAINSHVIYQIARDFLRHDPDLLVVYMGNNEVIGPFGVGTVFGPFSRHLSLIRLGISPPQDPVGPVHRLGSLNKSHERLLRSWGGMEMFLDKQIRPGGSWPAGRVRTFPRQPHRLVHGSHRGWDGGDRLHGGQQPAGLPAFCLPAPGRSGGRGREGVGCLLAAGL